MKQIVFTFCALYPLVYAQLPYNRLPSIPSNPLPHSLPQPPVIEAVPIININQAPVMPPTEPVTYGAFGQICDVTPYARCQATTDIITSISTPGFIQCRNDYDCCLCAAIECHDCVNFVAGNSGVYGVGAIMINGRDARYGGAELNCMGVESCSAAVIQGTNMQSMVISGDMGIKNAVVTITNPITGFQLECTGMASCEGLRLEIIIPAAAPGTLCSNEAFIMDGIECNGAESCSYMHVTIRNEGCNKVLIESLECTQIDACIEANFNLIGDIEIVHCDLGASGHTATGLSQCYQNLQVLLCQDAGSCRGIIKTLTNPSNAFSLRCLSSGSCQNAQLTINVDASSWWDPVQGIAFALPISAFEGFMFHGESAGAMATITINNEQRGQQLEIENIECIGLNACAHTTFVIGNNVVIGNIVCGRGIDTCSGCLVKVEANDPGIPCAEYAFI